MDVEKTVEFILSAQANLIASVQKQDEQLVRLTALIHKHDEQLAKLESSVATLTDLVGRLAQAGIELTERTERLAETTQAGFRELRELHANTEYKLNALIDTVDKLVRRDGHKE